MTRGLTLVEVLVSLVIVAMLMAAAMGITASLARSQVVLRKADAGPERLAQAVEAILKTDLLHAHHHRAARDGFSVQTSAHLVARSLALEHLPTAVTYQVRRVGERPCLFRTQAGGLEKLETDLVAIGVRAVRFMPGKDVQPNAEGWKPFAGRCAVEVEFEPTGETFEVAVAEDRSN